MAAAADPNSTTLFVGTVGNVSLLPSVLSSYDVDPLNDFRPVTQLAATPDVLIVNAKLGISNLEDLKEYAKQNTLTYSYIAPFSIHRMEFTQLISDLGINATVDPSLRGSGPAMEAVSNGTVDMVMTTVPYVAPMVAKGLVVPLAVAHTERLELFPDVPTMVESGINIPHGSWSGVLVPAGTSDEKIEQAYAALHYALTHPQVAAEIAEVGMVSTPSASPEACDQ